MNTKSYFLIASLAALGCDNVTPMGTDSGMTGNPDIAMGGAGDMAMGPDMKPPAAPAVGSQIDRLGRGTINVAVTNPFDLALPTGNRAMTRDAYNKDSDAAGWVAKWSPVLQINLAIYDGADSKCGNQVLACGMLGGCPMGSMPMAGRYATLGGLLADDRLYLDTTKTTCGAAYLSVEAGFPDCGGRTPTKGVDVVDFMYTVATVGAGGISGAPPNLMYAITDGVVDGDGTNVSLTTFPFLDEPTF